MKETIYLTDLFHPASPSLQAPGSFVEGFLTHFTLSWAGAGDKSPNEKSQSLRISIAFLGS